MGRRPPSPPKAKCPEPGCREEGGTSQEDISRRSRTKKQHLVHALNPPQSPTCRAVRFLPDQEGRTQPKNDSPNIFWRKEGKEGGRAGWDVITSLPHSSAHLVLLCTHCPRSTWPIRSRRSCKLVHSPRECLLTASLCGYNSCARYTPFPQQPVETEEHTLHVGSMYSQVSKSKAGIKVPQGLPVLPCPQGLVTSELFLLHLLRNRVNFL